MLLDLSVSGHAVTGKRTYQFKGQKVPSAAPAASEADFSGTWKLLYTGTEARGFKTLGSIILDLKVNGSAVTGVAHLASWPGDAPIADGKMEGQRITFTAAGTHSSTTGIPTCQFELTVHGAKMAAVMTVIRNSFLPPGASLEFTGQKTSE
jgi:hypothetical protein